MTVREKRFADYYLSNGCIATRAAISAGFEHTTAFHKTSAMLKKPEIANYIKMKLHSMENKLEIDIEWKFKKLKKIIDLCVPDEPDISSEINPSVAISAIAELNKMQGHYAPSKSENINHNSDESKVKELIEKYKKHY